MTDTAKHLAAAVAAVLIAATSMTAVVTVPAVDNGQAVATITAPEIA